MSSIAKMRWKDKLKLLYCITSDLVAIHSQGLEHRDLHSAKRCMDPNPKKWPTTKSVNFQVGFWNEEILNSDDDNEIKRQFFEIKLIIHYK
ncbi:putative Non-specific protein-tyrosine kinase [Gigaspora margarita]|uniref:Putative Non-specific protein-tyrosine kinase n=1 Tax=Gigaspora margarita TaxID=4874 RepID=A0A8H3X406_GIGMA|nr:putative Non-specific protein-tyrosine kinase [Gigaspora margarita]